MWYQVVWKIVKLILMTLPAEQIVAHVYSIMLAKAKTKIDIETISKTVSRIEESSKLIQEICADSVIDENEMVVIKSESQKIREEILQLWAKGQKSKPLEKKLLVK